MCLGDDLLVVHLQLKPDCTPCRVKGPQDEDGIPTDPRGKVKVGIATALMHPKVPLQAGHGDADEPGEDGSQEDIHVVVVFDDGTKQKDAIKIHGIVRGVGIRFVDGDDGDRQE